MLTLPTLINQTVGLTDAQGRAIGSITVETVDDDLVTGSFVPGRDYGAVRKLFQDFEEAADAQALGVVDEYERQIDALGLSVRPAGAPPVRVYDVQIWSDGGVSCRFRPDGSPVTSAGAANGTVARPPVQTDQPRRPN